METSQHEITMVVAGLAVLGAMLATFLFMWYCLFAMSQKTDDNMALFDDMEYNDIDRDNF